MRPAGDRARYRRVVQPVDLRPLRAGEILDVAIKIYRSNAGTLFRLVAIVVAPVQALTVLVLASAVPDARFLIPEIGVEPTPQQIRNFGPEDIWPFVAGTVVVIILTLISTTLSTAACFKAVGDAYLGNKPRWRPSLSFAAKHLGAVLWVAFLGTCAWLAPFVVSALAAVPLALAGIDGGVAVGLVVITLLVAAGVAVWLYVSYAVAVPALLTEEVRGRRALARSYRLVKGRWWPTFGILAVGSILAGIVGNVIGVAFTGITFTDVGENTVLSLIINALGGTIASVLTTPFTAAFVAVMYFDLRVRKEGMDLELLADRMGAAPPYPPRERDR